VVPFSPASPVLQKAKLFLSLFSHLIWLNMASFGRPIFCQHYVTTLTLWRPVIFSYHWPQFNRTVKDLQVLIRPKEHTEYNATY